MHLAMNDDIKSKVLSELKEKVFKEELLAADGAINIQKCLTYEKIQDLSYFMMVFNETLRLEPPVIFSGVMKLTEEQTINGLKILPSDSFIVSFQQLHHDPDQWIDHERFIPERFDHSSPYYLTPSGKKRHPLAFSPFLGGKRICIGKTYAEIVGKLVVTGFLARLDFEFEDPS